MRTASALWAPLLVITAYALAQNAPLAGRVFDAAGGTIARAEVEVRQRSGSVYGRAVSTTDGSFRFDSAPDSGVIIVAAPGFAERALTFNPQLREVTVRLTVAPSKTEIVVTAARAPLARSETAESVEVLSQADLSSEGALTLDDKLRVVPGFTLFRRSSSRVANPSTQGVSLRGTGATGASRVLVTSDGVPLNDPFGGWVYWDRVPAQTIETVEILRGGASHLYGTGALGGVVNLVPLRVADVFRLDATLDSVKSPYASMLAGHSFGRWNATISAEGFRSDGYILVRPEDRGAVDVAARSRYGVMNARIARAAGAHGSVFAAGTVFNEGRDNGTPLQVNSTRLAEAVVGADLSKDTNVFTIRGFGTVQQFVQTFSAIAANRNSESLTRWDRVPSQRAGFSSQWSRNAGRHAISAGTDFVQILGASDGVQFASARPTSERMTSGRQQTVGVYGRDSIRLAGRVALSLGARFDHWHNYNAIDLTRIFPSGAITATRLADHSDDAFSPHASLLVHGTDRLSFSAAGYGAFRAPTLQELYRGFRVGNVVTLANEALSAERLTGAEAGVNYAVGPLTWRATYFWSEVRDPVISRTLTVTPALITRQRQNLGRTGTNGVELAAETRIRQLTLRAGYQFARARVLSSPNDPELEGKQLPQVPEHSFTFDARFAHRTWMLAAQGRASSRQFDDDQNLLPLARFFTLDGYVARRLTESVSLFAAAENLTGVRYEVGRTPVVTLGPPAIVRGGVRISIGR